ncbi:hypothetical protein ACA910_019480 [Epithemia clementina (nom. ined.)]
MSSLSLSSLSLSLLWLLDEPTRSTLPKLQELGQAQERHEEERCRRSRNNNNRSTSWNETLGAAFGGSQTKRRTRRKNPLATLAMYVRFVLVFVVIGLFFSCAQAFALTHHHGNRATSTIRASTSRSPQGNSYLVGVGRPRRHRVWVATSRTGRGNGSWSTVSLAAAEAGSNANQMFPLQPGSTVALVTPFDRTTGAVQYDELRHLLQWHVQAGTQNLCILGTTGESNLLSNEERIAVLQTAVREVKGHMPILAGTGSIDPIQVKAMTQQAADLGCDAALVVTPYYVKPPQRGLIQHYLTLANMPNALPVVVYNVPGRTAVDLSDESLAILAQHENIIGVKDATGKVERLPKLLQLLREQQQSSLSSSSFLCLSGDDGTMLDYCLQGGQGCISVTANVAPRQVRQVLDQAALACSFTDTPATQQAAIAMAHTINNKLMGLHQDLFCEANPIPTKWALTQPIVRTTSDLTVATPTTTTEPILSYDYCRPPLASMDPKFIPLLEQALRQAELLL